MKGSIYDDATAQYEVLVDQVLEFIRCSQSREELQFNELALKLFNYQFQFNTVYQVFCRQQGKTPRTVKDWRDIPAVPLQAFKRSTLSCTDSSKAEAIFMTSGTSNPEMRGKHYHPSLRLYDASMLAAFQQHIMGGNELEVIKMIVLFPTKQQLPHSSLAHYLHLAVQYFGTDDSSYAVNEQGVDVERVVKLLESAEQAGEPVLLIGATFSFVHLLEQLQYLGRSFQLPTGSKLMDTGGTKGRSREVEQEQLYSECVELLGITRSGCSNMYGMTELSTQYYETSHDKPGQKFGPPWIATRVVNPLTGKELPVGEVGVIVHCDLGNVNSVTTILTDDLGYMTEDGGILLLGRAQGAAAKGCSLVMEEFVAATNSFGTK